ncbi:MAG: hypothetical protein C7B47_15060 [Sulfobacillus thermosulfidooxidans]|uniref:Uncharacterized protein n=1 Tax=Sulfobacillus thermosulfidooxidans TaxID=28034 RepID=A0A2T2WQ08_SULTH|nr:MAG: hypothetical protein C7B47_15060 [Sulfobacillus thermosulfidooxidans]
MGLNKDQIYLYAAYDADYSSAQTIASHFGLPYGNVLGSFATAWTAVASGKFMVIAIGVPANNALYYNPCNFGSLGGTPFYNLDTPQDTLPPAGYYMNAAGETGQDSYQLAYNYVYYALNGNCNGCGNGGNPVTPADSCVGRNPVNANANGFCSSCSTYCSGSSCDTLSSIESTAVNSGWDPESIAQSVLNLINGMGQSTYGMDRYMAVAAMETQGCYNSPNACTQYGYSCNCQSPEVNEGFGVLQETWNGTALNHASTALNEVTNHGQSTKIWFPAGITPCTVLTDPGTAFAEFYWWAFSDSANNCGTIRDWIGGPCSAVCCAIQQYYAQTGISCSSSSCGCSA